MKFISYNKCINENDQLSYVTNGKYNNCSKMLADLAKSGIDASADIGFGKINFLVMITKHGLDFVKKEDFG